MKLHSLLGLLTASVLAGPLPSARAERSHDALRARVGPPSAPHAMRRVDARRSGQSATRLSSAPHVERRLRVALGVGRGLVTLADGGFFIVHSSPRASRFDAQGKLLYSLKLPAEPSSAPVVTSAGWFAFSAGGELHVIDDHGKQRARTALGENDPSVRSILATRDGGVLLTSYGTLIKVSAFGDLVWRRSTSEGPFELLETSAGVLCVTLPGNVYRLDAAGRLLKLGELGGSAGSITATAAGDQLLARTGNHRLVSFDLREHRLRSSVEDATLDLDGPVLQSSDRLAHVFTNDGLLVRYRPDGSEAQRIPVDPGSRKAPDPDEVLLLADGRLLIARDGMDVAVVTAAGEVSTIAGSACPDPVGIFAAGTKAVLLACRSGNMLRIE
jgi:hypothetical protein